MPLSRQQKEQRIQETAEHLSAATAYAFMSFDALTVDDLEALRDQAHAEGVRIRVIPKRLLRRVLQAVGLEYDPTEAAGQVAVAWGNDVVAPARILYQFTKNRDTVQLLAGSMEGSLLDQERILALAQLPSRDELLGRLVGSLSAPLRGFQGVLSGVPRSLMYALNAIADSKK